MIVGLGMGGTKTGEYCRTIDMLRQMTGLPTHKIMRILYFLHDCQYDNQDLGEMANILLDGINRAKCCKGI